MAGCAAGRGPGAADRDARDPVGARQGLDVGGRRLRGGHRERPQAVPWPGRPDQPLRRGGVPARERERAQPAVRGVRGRAPGAPGPADPHRSGGDRPTHPPDRRRAGRPRLQPPRVPAARRLPLDHRGADDRRRRGGRRPDRLAHHGRAVRRALPCPADDVRGAGGARPAQRRALLGAPGTLGRARAQGRRDGGPGRDRAGDQLDARPGRGAHDDRRARRRALRRGRRVAHGVRRGESALPGAGDVRHEPGRP